MQMRNATGAMPSSTGGQAGRFQVGPVVDTHVHVTGYLPRYADEVYRWFTRPTVPAPFPLANLPLAGVDALVVNAVGDRLVTVMWAQTPWHVVASQVRRIRSQADAAGASVDTSARQVRRSLEAGRVAVLLGLEGGDAIGTRLDRLDELFRWGVRVFVPVHFRDNQIGTTALPWLGYLGLPSFPSCRRKGLTPFGRTVVRRMNDLGMLIDVSHADATTLLDIAALTRQPIVASHAGAKAVEPFARFLGDAEIDAVSETGGLVGLWPYRYKGHGPADLNALINHATYIAERVGVDRLCLGTDMNALPGASKGYRGEQDVRLFAEHLRAAGFGRGDVEAVMGGNFLRVLEQVTDVP